MKAITSDDDEERSLPSKHVFLVDQHDLLVLSIVDDICSQVVEVIGLADLIPELSVYWHRLDLTIPTSTDKVIVAPDSRSPNLKNPVHMWVSLLKKRKNLFLNSGNFFSQGNPVSYSIS